LDGFLSHSFEGSSQNAMLWKLKAIGWVACAGGWLLVVAGVGLGLGPIVLQTYLEMEDAKVGPAGSSVEKKVISQLRQWLNFRAFVFVGKCSF